MSSTIRSATAADVSTIANLDFFVNLNHPITQIPWPSQADGLNMFNDRYQFFFKQPEYHFLVAEVGSEIVGFAIWKEAKKGEEWKPDFPEGTNLKFFGALVATAEQKQKELGLDGLAGRFHQSFPLLEPSEFLV